MSDYPEMISQAFIQFELEEGTLADLDAASARVDVQMNRIAERRKQQNQAAAKKKHEHSKFSQQVRKHFIKYYDISNFKVVLGNFKGNFFIQNFCEPLFLAKSEETREELVGRRLFCPKQSCE